MSADATEPNPAPPAAGPGRAADGPPGTRPEPPAAPPRAHVEDEVEVWWGSYSGWAMLPSFAVCLVLTAVAAWVVWQFVPRHLMRAAVLVAGAAIWGVQLYRVGSRVFGRNYRLTTRRLLVMRGVRRMRVKAVDLARVRGVTVERTGLERMAGVGRVLIEADGEPKPVVLAAVRNPVSAADTIREAARAAWSA